MKSILYFLILFILVSCNTQQKIIRKIYRIERPPLTFLINGFIDSVKGKNHYKAYMFSKDYAEGRKFFRKKYFKEIDFVYKEIKHSGDTLYLLEHYWGTQSHDEKLILFKNIKYTFLREDFNKSNYVFSQSSINTKEKLNIINTFLQIKENKGFDVDLGYYIFYKNKKLQIIAF